MIALTMKNVPVLGDFLDPEVFHFPNIGEYGLFSTTVGLSPYIFATENLNLPRGLKLRSLLGPRSWDGAGCS